MEIITDKKILLVSKSSVVENKNFESWSAIVAPLDEVAMLAYWVLHKECLPEPVVLLDILQGQNIQPANWLSDLAS